MVDLCNVVIRDVTRLFSKKYVVSVLLVLDVFGMDSYFYGNGMAKRDLTAASWKRADDTQYSPEV